MGPLVQRNRVLKEGLMDDNGQSIELGPLMEAKQVTCPPPVP